MFSDLLVAYLVKILDYVSTSCTTDSCPLVQSTSRQTIGFFYFTRRSVSVNIVQDTSTNIQMGECPLVLGDSVLP